MNVLAVMDAKNAPKPSEEDSATDASGNGWAYAPQYVSDPISINDKQSN